MRLFILAVLLVLPVGLPAQAQSRLETILNIETDRGSILERRQMVEVPAGQLFAAAERAGAGYNASVNVPLFIPGCGAWDAGDSIHAEFFSPINVVGGLSPPQIDPTDIICQIRILGMSLNNGWRLEELNDTSVDCSAPNLMVITLERASDSPNDMTHIVTFTADPQVFSAGACYFDIDTAVLSGPFGQRWRDAF